MGGGQEMDRDGGRRARRSNRPRDINKIDVPRDEEGGADVGSGFTL